MFDEIFESIGKRSEKKIQEEFKIAHEIGREEGVLAGMSMNFEKTRELSDPEYQEVIDFLVSRGLELCCFDAHRGGFSIRKREFPNAPNTTPISIGEKIEVFTEHGKPTMGWRPATYYAKSIHENKPYENCYIVAYEDDGSLDQVTTIRRRPAYPNTGTSGQL